MTGDPGNRNRGVQSANVRDGGSGSADGTVWNNINTGNNRYGHPRQESAPTDISGNFPDVEGDYQQGMREVSRLRERVKDDPQAVKNFGADPAHATMPEMLGLPESNAYPPFMLLTCQLGSGCISALPYLDLPDMPQAYEGADWQPVASRLEETADIFQPADQAKD